MTRMVWPTATVARFLPRRAASRRYCAGREVPLVRPAAWAAFGQRRAQPRAPLARPARCAACRRSGGCPGTSPPRRPGGRPSGTAPCPCRPPPRAPPPSAGPTPGIVSSRSTVAAQGARRRVRSRALTCAMRSSRKSMWARCWRAAGSGGALRTGPPAPAPAPAASRRSRPLASSASRAGSASPGDQRRQHRPAGRPVMSVATPPA